MSEAVLRAEEGSEPWPGTVEADRGPEAEEGRIR